jgi:hypothetical protein
MVEAVWELKRRSGWSAFMRHRGRFDSRRRHGRNIDGCRRLTAEFAAAERSFSRRAFAKKAATFVIIVSDPTGAAA